MLRLRINRFKLREGVSRRVSKERSRLRSKNRRKNKRTRRNKGTDKEKDKLKERDKERKTNREKEIEEATDNAHRETESNKNTALKNMKRRETADRKIEIENKTSIATDKMRIDKEKIVTDTETSQGQETKRTERNKKTTIVKEIDQIVIRKNTARKILTIDHTTMFIISILFYKIII